MNSGLAALGIIILIGTFFFTEVMITPQQRQQIEIANKMCGASIFGIPVGQIGQAVSADAANACKQAGDAYQSMSMAPIGYILGFILLVIGLVAGGKKGDSEPKSKHKKTVEEEKFKCDVCGKIYANQKEAVRCEARHEFEKEPDKKTEILKTKFCKKCGTKIKEGVKFCTKCGNKL
jgi:ribosomal protein L40E